MRSVLIGSEYPVTGTPLFLWLYVNSWGRGKKGKIESRVGEKAPARFLSIAEADHSEELIFHTISQ